MAWSPLRSGFPADVIITHFITASGSPAFNVCISVKDDGSFSGKATKEAFVDSDAAKSAETYPITFRKM